MKRKLLVCLLFWCVSGVCAWVCGLLAGNGKAPSMLAVVIGMLSVASGIVGAVWIFAFALEAYDGER